MIIPAPRKNDPDLTPVFGRRVTVLGSTGSVGVGTLDVIRFAREHYGPDSFPIEVLTAQTNVALLAAQAIEFRPRAAVIGDNSLRPVLKDALAGTGVEALGGHEAILDGARRPSDMVMAGIVGAAGLEPTLIAMQRGAIIALANKECIVAAGEVFRRAAEISHGVIIPVDSEHNAAFQLLDFAEAHAIEKLTLTASGGPFRTWSLDHMAQATPEQAVAHPTWSMGAKISVDSASLMNKGLELIEAKILFNLPPEKLDVVVHPQSTVHCLVAYSDGSVLAHLSAPDMRTPIANAMGWPRRIASPSRRLDFTEFRQLNFEMPDLVRFPCLELAMACLRTGGAAPTILNAANEIAVAEFLGRRLGFLGIARTVEHTLKALARETNSAAPATLEDVLALDGLARVKAREQCGAAAA